MTAPAITVRPETAIRQVIRMLHEHSVTAFPVVDDDGRLVGVVSEADVILDSVPPDPRAHEIPVHLSSGPFLTQVSEVMNHHPLTTPVDGDLAEAAELMTSTMVKSLPVVDGETVVGVVSRRDIIAALARSDDAIEAEIDDLVRQLGMDWLVEVEDGVVLVQGPVNAREQELARTLVGTVPGAVGIRFGQTDRSPQEKP
jgi:CBS domain-containing protein